MNSRDNLTPEQRVRAMRAVRSTSSAEATVRDALRALKVRIGRGLTLPGRPDFVLPDQRIALFVNGCFWHAHGCRPLYPVANRSYWKQKLASNVRRDRRVRRQLNRAGWSVVVLWECKLSKQDPAASVLRVMKRARRY